MRRVLPFEAISREPFEALPEDLRSDSLFRGGEMVNQLVDAACLAVLADLGVSPEEVERVLEEGDFEEWTRRALAMAERAGVAEKRRATFVWLFHWIGDPGRTAGFDLEGSEEGLQLRELPSLEELEEQIEKADPQVLPHAQLIRFAATSYAAFLRGEREGDQILFQPGTLSLWERFFSNEHRINRCLNLLGAFAVEQVLGERRGCRVVELGGGLGSAAELVLDSCGDRVDEYLFTDLAAGFVRRGAARLEERYPRARLETARVDINQDLTDQGLRRASFDLVYACNVLHLAVDLLASLKRIRELVADSGALVFVEGVRPLPQRPIAAEFIFQLLSTFRDVDVSDTLRPTSGFLTARQWERALKEAGFGSVDIVPDPEAAIRAYPNHYMAVLTARP